MTDLQHQIKAALGTGWHVHKGVVIKDEYFVSCRHYLETADREKVLAVATTLKLGHNFLPDGRSARLYVA